MKRIVFCLGVAVLAGCAGVTKEELNTVKRELLANDAAKAAELFTRLTGVDQKYVLVQQVELKVRGRLEEMTTLHKRMTETSAAMDAKVSLASTTVVRMLEFEERLLKERLATIRTLIEELKN